MYQVNKSFYSFEDWRKDEIPISEKNEDFVEGLHLDGLIEYQTYRYIREHQEEAFFRLVDRLTDKLIKSFKKDLDSKVYTISLLENYIQEKLKEGWSVKHGYSLESIKNQYKRHFFWETGLKGSIVKSIKCNEDYIPPEFELTQNKNRLMCDYVWLNVLERIKPLKPKKKDGRGNRDMINNKWEPPIGFYAELKKLKTRLPDETVGYYIGILKRRFNIKISLRTIRRRLNEVLK